MSSPRLRTRRRRAAPGREPQRIILLLALFLGAVGLAGAIMMASPRHRAFYLSAFRAERKLLSPPAEEARPPASSPSQASPSEVAVPVTDTASESDIQAVTISDQSILRIIEAPPKLPLQGAPPRWAIKTFAGQPHVETVAEDRRPVIRLMSQQSSFALYRDVTVNLEEYPFLSWSWKVLKLPKGGDVRRATSDDEAAQLYVIFPQWPYPKVNSEVLGYVWDSRAPAGLMLQSPRAANVRLIVLQSGQEKVGRWVKESRNVAEDYRALFGKAPPVISRVAVMVDSNDTRSEAEALFQDLVFHTPDRRQSGLSRVDDSRR